MMGIGVVGQDGASLAALLEVVSDPEAAKAKLAEFNAKIEEAKGFLAQAKDVNAENERLVREITEKTDSAFKAQAAKEAELINRENHLVARHQELTSGHQEVATVKGMLQVLEQELAQKALKLTQKEQEGEAAVSKFLANAEKTFADRKMVLEQEYAVLKTKAQQAYDDANAKAILAAETLASALEKKLVIDKRAAALKQAMEG